MGLYSTVLKKVVFPTLDRARGTKVIKYWNELEKTQWLMREDLIEMQEDRLKAMVRHAYDNVPYYRRTFKEAKITPDDIRSVADLKKIPLLTRDDIRAAGKEMLSTNWHQLDMQKPIEYTTSGSTAEPLRFYLTNEGRSWASAAKYRAWAWADFNLGDKYATVWGSHMDIKAHEKTFGQIKNSIRKQIMLDALRITEKDLAEFALSMAEFRPKVVRGYASGIFLLAQYLEKNPDDRIEPRAVITTAETLLPHHREKIEAVLGCPVFDWYGSRETSLIAHECKEHTGYHISVENSVLEFIKGGEEVAEGELGQIAVTDLHNYAMPFIRYDIGDAGRPSDLQCPCGRGLPLFASIEGRVVDFIITDSGDLISPGFFGLLFQEARGIIGYQVVQNKKGKATIRYVEGPEFSEKEIETIKKRILENTPDIQITFKKVKEIDPETSGKRRFTKSKVRADFL